MGKRYIVEEVVEKSSGGWVWWVIFGIICFVACSK